jgi:hypothetical protein
VDAEPAGPEPAAEVIVDAEPAAPEPAAEVMVDVAPDAAMVTESGEPPTSDVIASEDELRPSEG